MDRTIAAWLAPEEVPLRRSARAGAGLRIVGAGSPARGQSGPVAAELGAAALDDIRAMLGSAEASLVVIAAPRALGAGPTPGEAAGIRAARARGARVAVLEPVPAAALDMASGWTEAGGGPRALD